MAKLFDELAALKKAYNDKLKNEGEAAMKEAFKEVLDKHPSIHSIEWTQYTPYFNDGDPCYFRMNEFEIDFYEDDDDAIAADDHDKAYDDVGTIFDDAGEDVFESIFGDHRRIEVTRDGIAVSKYNHD